MAQNGRLDSHPARLAVQSYSKLFYASPWGTKACETRLYKGMLRGGWSTERRLRICPCTEMWQTKLWIQLWKHFRPVYEGRKSFNEWATFLPACFCMWHASMLRTNLPRCHALLCFWSQYSLVQWNWFSDVNECMKFRCIQWRQRTNFAAPGCTWKPHCWVLILRNKTKSWKCYLKEKANYYNYYHQDQIGFFSDKSKRSVLPGYFAFEK